MQMRAHKLQDFKKHLTDWRPLLSKNEIAFLQMYEEQWESTHGRKAIDDPDTGLALSQPGELRIQCIPKRAAPKLTSSSPPPHPIPSGGNQKVAPRMSVRARGLPFACNHLH